MVRIPCRLLVGLLPLLLAAGCAGVPPPSAAPPSPTREVIPFPFPVETSTSPPPPAAPPNAQGSGETPEAPPPVSVEPTGPADPFAVDEDDPFGESRPVPEGVQVSLRCDREEWILGETCILRLVLRNAGKEPFPIMAGMDFWGLTRDPQVQVWAVHEDGGEAEDPGETGFYTGGIMKPGQGLYPGSEREERIPIARYRRIDRAGTWILRARHGFGWKDTPERPVPSAEIRLRFRAPTDAEARRILEANLAAGGKGPPDRWEPEAPWHEPAALAVPAYFPLVAEKARKGNPVALEAATWLPTVDATRLLIECLPVFPDGDAFDRLAYRLGSRLPMPSGETFHPFLGQDRYPSVPWDPALERPVREWAIRTLKGEDPFRMEMAGQFLECLPPRAVATSDEARDLPSLRASLIRRLTGVADVDWETQGALPRGTASIFAAWRAAGGVPEFPPRDLADGFGFLFAMQSGEAGRPEGWEKVLAGYLQDARPWIRASAVAASPCPPPPAVRERIPALLKDPASQVRLRACFLAESVVDPASVTLLVELLEREADFQVVESAFFVACRRGERLAASRKFARRLETIEGESNPNLGYAILHHLGEAWIVELEGRGGGSGEARMTPKDWSVLSDVWKVFLEVPGATLDPRKRFHITDPAIVPGLFAPAYRFGLEDGTMWPPPGGR